MMSRRERLPDDFILISILPEVSLVIAPVDTQQPFVPHGGDTLQVANRFKVVGPEKPIDFLRGLEDEAAYCTLSPLSPVTVPPKARASAGIPMKAHFFAFIYPWNVDKLGDLKFAQNAWAFVMLLGGFAYFRADGSLISVNAITYDTADASGLMIVGPCRASMTSFQAMASQGRMKAITASSLLEAGFQRFGWVHPSEHFSGKTIGEGRDQHETYDFGAFLYLRKEPVEGSELEALFYHLVPSTSKVYSQMKKRMSAAGSELSLKLMTPAGSELSSRDSERPVPVRSTSRNQALSAAYHEETRRSTAAVRTKKAAGQVVKAATTERRGPSFREVFKELIIATIIVGVYVGGGVLFYINNEFHECDYTVSQGSDAEAVCPWTTVDAIYFISATLSTAGYGDLYPSSGYSRFFTAPYILIGVFVVFGVAGHLVKTIIEWIEAVFMSMMSRLARLCRISDSTKSDQAAQLERALWYYTKNLGFFLTFGLTISWILFPWLLTLAQPGLSAEDALWHCYITSTTVGYGDVAISEQSSRALAAAQIFFSVSWLAALAGRIQYAIEKRKLQKQRAWLVEAQLDEGMVDALDKDGLGVDQLEFVVGLLTTLGVTLCGEPLSFENDVRPLIDRFQALDADGSGRLTREDLEFMVEESRSTMKHLPVSKISRKTSQLHTFPEESNGSFKAHPATKAEGASNHLTYGRPEGRISPTSRVGASGPLIAGAFGSETTQQVSNAFDRAFNTVERITGIDLDGDGHVGEMGGFKRKSKPPTPNRHPTQERGLYSSRAEDADDTSTQPSSPTSPPVLSENKSTLATKARI